VTALGGIAFPMGGARSEPRDLHGRRQRFPMIGERAVSRAALEAGGNVFPVVGERGVSCVALAAGGSAFPVMGRCMWSR
jgi:hypothetical protein